MPKTKQVKRKLSETLRPEVEKYTDTVLDFHEAPAEFEPRDEDLVSAAEALTRLTKSATPPPPSFHDDRHDVSIQNVLPFSDSSLPGKRQQIHPIVKRVNTISKLPLVTNAVKYYETSKRNYATFNYAAGIVEKAAVPMFNKLEVNLNNKHQAKLEEQARTKKKRRVNHKEEKHEIKRRIKFCLHILKLANDNISSKVVDLQEKMREAEALKTSSTTSPSPVSQLLNDNQNNLSVGEISPTSTNSPEKTLQTNNEIVATVKKIVHVISNFRPSSLNVGDEVTGSPNEDVKLKKTIREIILSLPKQVSHTVPGAQKAPNQAICFARESLDMIGRLTIVFNEQLEKAEHWVDKSTEDKPLFSQPSESPTPSEQTKVNQPGIVRLKSQESFHSFYSLNESTP